MNKDRRLLYLNMFIGTIGTLLIALTAIGVGIKEGTTSVGYAMGCFGFIFTIIYINFLEKKAGISMKLTWIRSCASIIIFLTISYFLYLR